MLWHGDPAAPQIALVRRRGSANWCLPQSPLVAGEHPLVTAVRSAAEQAGVRATPGRYLTALHQFDEHGGTRRYWALRAEEVPGRTGGAVDDVRWLPAEQAATLLSHPAERRPLARLLALPLGLTPVLLVRHGQAGERGRWDGPDMTRPLDAAGRRQARLLSDVAVLYAPCSLGSADVSRCVQTLEPLAARLSLAVRLEPAFEESRFAGNPAIALRRLREVAGIGHAAAVCSQGRVIPPLLGWLSDLDLSGAGGGSGGRARLGPAGATGPRARKGSVWVLFFAGAQLRDAYYLPRLDPARGSPAATTTPGWRRAGSARRHTA